MLPLTPAGNATERHILVAYDAAARRVFAERARLVDFWAARLGSDPAAVEGSLTPEPSPNDLIRSRLMKQGGVGYGPADEGTFPPLETSSGDLAAGRPGSACSTALPRVSST